jgi:hypothetical protein
MMGIDGLWVTVGGTSGPSDILLLGELGAWTAAVAADGAGFPKSASNDEAASSFPI